MEKDAIFAGIVELVKHAVEIQGSCLMIYGSWNGNFTSEDRDIIASLLSDEGVETITIYDYADLFIYEDIDDEQKQILISNAEETAPQEFESAVVRNWLEKQKPKLHKCFRDNIIAIQAINNFINQLIDEIDETEQ